MSLRIALAAILVGFAFSAPKADANIFITFTPLSGPAAVTGAMDSVGIGFLQSIIVVVNAGTVANFTNSISDADVLSLTVRLDSTDYTYDDAPTEFNDNTLGSLGNDLTFSYFVPANGGQNIQIADGASVFALNGTTVKTGGLFGSVVGNGATTFNGGANAITAASFIAGKDILFGVSVTAVPEPTSFAMFAIATFGMWRRRRKP